MRGNPIQCYEYIKGEYGKYLFPYDEYYPGFLSRCVPILDDNVVGFVLAGVSIEAPNYR